MAFWGVEIKPNESYIHHYDGELGRLHLSQATLGNGSSNKKSIVQCHVGDKKPIYLASLLPEKLETCPLNIEFEEEDDVTFSVIGSHSIHLSGFYYGESHDDSEHGYGSDSYEEGIAVTDDSDEEDLTGDEYDDSFSDSDIDMCPPSHFPNSGVRIEEILDEEKDPNGNAVPKQSKKKNYSSKLSGKSDDSQRQIVPKSKKGGPVLEDEDEDGFPITSPGMSNAEALNNKALHDQKARKESKNVEDEACTSIKSLKRKINERAQDNEKTSTGNVSETSKKKKKSKKKKIENGEVETQEVGPDAVSTEHIDKSSLGAEDKTNKLTDSEAKVEEMRRTEKGKKKDAKTNKKLEITANGNMEQDEKADSKPFQVRTFPNGLVVEELKMGRPDGKRASPGKKVSVRYIGKLKKNGKIFDSNVGSAPFKFRLGIGQVIKGWDVGVNGMRVGDKRRLTIPPAMGYGSKGAGPAIPPNSWLAFDVELVDVN